MPLRIDLAMSLYSFFCRFSLRVMRQTRYMILGIPFHRAIICMQYLIHFIASSLILDCSQNHQYLSFSQQSAMNQAASFSSLSSMFRKYWQWTSMTLNLRMLPICFQRRKPRSTFWTLMHALWTLILPMRGYFFRVWFAFQIAYTQTANLSMSSF